MVPQYRLVVHPVLTKIRMDRGIVYRVRKGNSAPEIHHPRYHARLIISVRIQPSLLLCVRMEHTLTTRQKGYHEPIYVTHVLQDSSVKMVCQLPTAVVDIYVYREVISLIRTMESEV